MDGRLTVEEGDIYDLLDLVMRKSRWSRHRPAGAAAHAGAASSAAGSPSTIRHSASRRNVAHHYDLKDELYDLFLDGDRQYSCAYFPDPTHTHRGGAGRQEAPHRRQAAARARASGCSTSAAAGAGSACTLPRDAGVDVTGITLSDRAAQVSNARRAAAPASPSGSSFELRRLPRTRRGRYRPHRLGRHVRACRRRPLRRLFPQGRASC